MTNTQFESTDQRIAELNSTIEALRKEITQLNETIMVRDIRIQAVEADGQRSRERHAQDIGAIGNALLEEAEHRDWCDDYDHFVETLNESLFINLPLRTRTYTMRVTATVRLEVEVDATNSEEAENKARDIATQALIDMEDSYDWDIEDIDQS